MYIYMYITYQYYSIDNFCVPITVHCVYVHIHLLSIIITRIIKNIFNKNERRCRDVKTQKVCKQGWEANIGPKIKQTTSI